jgi:hypothetical protein
MILHSSSAILLHSSSAILRSSLPIKKRWGLPKFHIACCFQQLQTHWMIASHSMRLGKKNSTNLEQLDYSQDLNRLLFSNVVDQAVQKTEYYLAYYIWGDKQASSSSKITGIHKSSSAPGRFLQLMSTDMSLMESMIQMRLERIFTRALWIIWSWTSCATLAHLFFFPQINIAASENRHVGCNSLSMCPFFSTQHILLKNNSPITGQH